jgi:hypothetical protein
VNLRAPWSMEIVDGVEDGLELKVVLRVMGKRGYLASRVAVAVIGVKAVLAVVVVVVAAGPLLLSLAVELVYCCCSKPTPPLRFLFPFLFLVGLGLVCCRFPQLLRSLLLSSSLEMIQSLSILCWIQL